MANAPCSICSTNQNTSLDLAVDWAAAEGWNPGLHDAECLHAADPGGFLMAFVDGCLVLDNLAEATARVRQPNNVDMLTVSTLGSLAANWLIPRLGSLRREQPTLDVRVQMRSERSS